MGRLRTLLLVARPWSFTFTVLVILLSSILPLARGLRVDWGLVVVAVSGSVLLHAMVNLLNDYYDYSMRIDRPGVGTVEYRPHPIVHGILTPRSTLLYGLAAGAAGLGLAAYASLSRPYAIVLGGLGFLLAYAYSGSPFGLKYKGLGELGVFIAWGILIPVGSYYLASGSLSLFPVAAALPVALGIVAVLMANNIRDVEADRSAGVRTVETVLGFDGSRRLFKAILGLSYASGLAVGLVWRVLLPGALLGLLTLPEGLRTAAMFDSGRAPPDADPRVAGLVQKYALLYILGLLLSLAVQGL